MTATADAPALSDLSEDQLATLYDSLSYDPQARAIIEAEGDRRDRNDKARADALQARRRDPVIAEWSDCALAQFRQAEAECQGNLVRRGIEITDPFSLWAGPEWLARRRATEELNNWWDDHPRIPTVTEWREHEREDIPPDDTPASKGATMTGHIAGEAIRAAGTGQDTAVSQADRLARLQEMGQAAGAAMHERAVAVRAPAAPVALRRNPDPAALLRRTLEGIGLLFTDYVQFPSRSSVIAVVTWNAQAAARNADGEPIWRAYPRLMVTSRQNGSGKSTVADLSRMVLLIRSGRMSKVTPYGLTKVLGVFKEAAIADDAQNVFKSDKAGADLLSIMINGYTRGATWVSGKGGDGKVEPAWGPMMIVGKDQLIKERGEVLKDLIDRSAVVRMERPDRYMPEVDEDAEARAASLGATLKAVTGALEPQLRQAARELAEENRGRLITDGDGGRTAQIWRPMLAIAKVAGDQWYQATLQAMEELSSAGGDLLKAEDDLTALEDLRDDGRSFWDEVPGQGSPVADDLYEEE